MNRDEREIDRLLSHLLQEGRGKPASAGACPDADRLAALAEGNLLAAERAAVDEHLRSCERCRGIVASIGRAGSSEVREPRSSRYRAIALAAAVVAAAAVVFFADPMGWRHAERVDSLRLDAPGIVLAAIGDVRSDGGKTVRFGSRLDPGATLRFEKEAAVRLLLPQRLLGATLSGRNLVTYEVASNVDWSSPADRDQRLSEIRSRILRSPPAGPGGAPRLLAPVGAIADSRPPFRWEGAAGPVLFKLIGPRGTWERDDAEGGRIDYPADLPPLEPGKPYVWSIEAPGESLQAGFRLRTDVETERVDVQIRRLQEGLPDEKARAFVSIGVLRTAQFFDRAEEAARSACNRNPTERLLLEEWALIREAMGDAEGARDLATRAANLSR